MLSGRITRNCRFPWSRETRFHFFFSFSIYESSGISPPFERFFEKIFHRADILCGRNAGIQASRVYYFLETIVNELKYLVDEIPYFS